MGSLSDFAEDELLDHVFNAAYSPDATIYIFLSTADPLDDASGIAEPSGFGYAREIITFDAPAARKVENAALITFNQASGGSWGTISHWGVCNHLSNGTWGTDVEMFAHGTFASSKVVSDGKTPTIAAQEVDIILNAGAMTTYLAHKLLDLMFRNQAYAKPDTFMALLVSDGADGDTDLTAKEPADGVGYVRKQVNINGGGSPTWDVSSGGAIANTHLIQMATPSGSWGTVTDFAIADTITGGNSLFYADLGGDEAIGNGDDVEFAIGAADITLS